MTKKPESPKPSPPEPAWQAPEGYIVSEARTFLLVVDNVRYEHVSEAPDGRWVYQRS